MAVINAAGSQFYLAGTFGSSVSGTTFTNAANAVITAAGHGCSVGDFIEILSSPWQRLEGRVFRISNIATNDLTLEGCDTSNTSLFPAAGGVGTTFRRVITWVTLTQISRDIEWTGGDLKTTDRTFISDVLEKEMPTYRGATSLGLPYFFDASLSWLTTARGFSDASATSILRMVTPNGQRAVQNGYIILNEVPTIRDNALVARLDCKGIALPTIYAT